MLLLKYICELICDVMYCACDSELPIFTTKAHVFHIDPDTKKKWLPLSTEAVSVSYYHDSARQLYRIISVDGTKVSECASTPVSSKACSVVNIMHMVIIFFSLTIIISFLQCFDAVGWAAGRASGP